MMVVPLEILVVVLAIEGALLALAIGLLGGIEAWRWSSGRRERPVLAWGGGVLASSVAGRALTDSELRQLQALPIRLRETLFVDLGRTLGHGHHARLAILAADVGLITWAEARCRSRLWWRRLHGVRLLTVLGEGERVIGPMLADVHPEVRAAAALGAVNHPIDQVVGGLLTLLTDPFGLCRFNAQGSLQRLGSSAVRPVATYLAAGPRGGLEGALMVAISIAEPAFGPAARALAHDPSAQVRGLATSLLAAIGGPDERDELAQRLDDPEPEVRARAARGLGVLAHWPAAAAVAGLLGDPDWRVRRESALALRGMGAPGLLLLRRSMASPDRFASDMARHVLDLSEPVSYVGVA